MSSPRGDDFAGLGVVLVPPGAPGRAGAPGDGLSYHRAPMMNRRRFLGTLGTGLLAAPVAAEAQSAVRVYRIGLFHVGLDHVPPSLNGLRDGLKALGYEEGRNLKLDFRNVADEAAAHAVALELVRQRPDLIVAFEDQTLRAALAATRELPVVFLHVGAGARRSHPEPRASRQEHHGIHSARERPHQGGGAVQGA